MGDPASVSSEYWEMDGEDVERLNYPGAVLYIKKENWKAYV